MVQIKDAPWFVAIDVYALLFGKTTGVSARAYLDESETQIVMKVSAPDALSSLFSGNEYSLALLSESGVYKMVMRSDKPEAKAFQSWVTGTVLPPIRKDGGYIKDEEKVVTGDMSEDELVLQVSVPRSGGNVLAHKCETQR